VPDQLGAIPAIGQSLAAGRTIAHETPAKLAQVASEAVELDGVKHAELDRLAVSEANAHGYTRILALVHPRNAPLFRRLHWRVAGELELHHRPHPRMEADIARYPAIPDPETPRDARAPAPTTPRALADLKATLASAICIAGKADINAACLALNAWGSGRFLGVSEDTIAIPSRPRHSNTSPPAPGSPPMTATDFDIFLATPPGLEPLLQAEARLLGFAEPEAAPGGVRIRGGWSDVWRANLALRGAGRVLVRIGAFYAVHLAQLDKRAHRLPWAQILPRGAAIRVDAVCENSRIWHGGAAAERVARAAEDALGAPATDDADTRILVRIVDDLCTISVDTSGEPLHRRGAKLAVGKAPIRETLAALFLRGCGYAGAESVLDPMCGAGTFILEAAQIAAGLAPGRARPFAFQRFPNFDAAAWRELLEAAPPRRTDLRFHGFDRDAGAVEMSRANAERAGVAGIATFRQQPVSALERPDGPPGLIIVNPPYGERIGDKADLVALYRTLGAVLRTRFAGWRVGLVTSEPTLARATGLPFVEPGPPVPHGPLRIRLHQTLPLA